MSLGQGGSFQYLQINPTRLLYGPLGIHDFFHKCEKTPFELMIYIL
jgi:hypothetical protein